MSHKKVTLFELLSVIGACIAAEGYLAFGSMGRAAVVLVVLACAAACGSWVNNIERGFYPVLGTRIEEGLVTFLSPRTGKYLGAVISAALTQVNNNGIKCSHL